MLKLTFPAGPPTDALAVTVPRGPSHGGCGGWTLGALSTTVAWMPGDGRGDDDPAGVVCCPLDRLALGLPAGVVPDGGVVLDGATAGFCDDEAGVEAGALDGVVPALDVGVAAGVVGCGFDGDGAGAAVVGGAFDGAGAEGGAFDGGGA